MATKTASDRFSHYTKQFGNLIGLTTEVQGKIIFLTNSPSRKLTVGKQEIIFRTTTEKNMRSAGIKVGLFIQVYRNLGQDNIDDNVRARTQKALKGTSRNEIVKLLKCAPQWIRSIIFDALIVTS